MAFAIPKISPKLHVKDQIAVEVGPDFIKLVHAVKSDDEELIFKNLVEKRFEGDSLQEKTEFLSKTLKELAISTREAVCVIPSTLFISKNVDMPSVDREEISKIVDLQAGRYTPYSRDEIVIDYLCMESAGQHYTNVLLLIVNRAVIDQYYQILEQAGLSVARFVIAAEGMANLYDAMAEAVTEDFAIAGLHISQEYSDLTVVDRHQLIFVRNLPLGSRSLAEGNERTRSEYLNELNKSIVAYRDQGIGRKIHTVFVTGNVSHAGFLEKGITQLEALQAYDSVSVQIVPYQSLFQTTEETFGNNGSAGETSYFDLMACLSALPAVKLDLTPKEIKLKKRVHEGGRDIMILGILIMTALIMACLFLATKIYIKSDVLQKLEGLESSISDEARLLEHASTKARVVRSLLKNRGRALYVFERVTSLIGKEIFLTQFSYDKEGNIELKGTADSMSRVYAFVTELEESNYFSSVKTKSTKTRRQGKKDVADFEIECVLNEEFL